MSLATDFLRDETGAYSMGRLMCLIWTVVFIAVVIVFPDRATPDFYTLMGGILLACIGWAGGNRVLAYVAPIFSAKTPRPPTDETTSTTDIQEFTEKG